MLIPVEELQSAKIGSRLLINGKAFLREVRVEAVSPKGNILLLFLAKDVRGNELKWLTPEQLQALGVVEILEPTNEISASV